MMRWFFALVLMGSLASAQSASELEILSRTNQVRLERGLKPLQWDNAAYKAAQGHARDMLDRNYFAHESPEGTDVSARLQAAGATEVTVGENLATFENYADATIVKRAMDGWINSPGHRANLLFTSFTHLGVAIVRKGNKVMVVQNFIGRPFNPQASISDAEAERYLLTIKGTAPGTLGVFVGSGLYTKLNPPFDTRLEIPPQAKISYALYDGKTWWAVQPGQQGVRLEGGIEVSKVPGKQVRLNFPTGQYTLALGKEPRFWQNLSGPTRLELVLPESLEILWLGIRENNSVSYSHRIPLKP